MTAGAYFLSGEVRQRLNLSGKQRPVHDDTDQYIDMLERVVDRGPMFRHVLPNSHACWDRPRSAVMTHLVGGHVALPPGGEGAGLFIRCNVGTIIIAIIDRYTK
jgi:hypothetical protein